MQLLKWMYWQNDRSPKWLWKKKVWQTDSLPSASTLPCDHLFFTMMGIIAICMSFLTKLHTFFTLIISWLLASFCSTKGELFLHILSLLRFCPSSSLSTIFKDGKGPDVTTYILIILDNLQIAFMCIILFYAPCNCEWGIIISFNTNKLRKYRCWATYPSSHNIQFWGLFLCLFLFSCF